MSTESKYSKENYIDKIKGLLDMNTENGCTESEAQAAMLMAQKLMAKHGIDMEEVSSTTEVSKEVVNEAASDSTKRNSWFEPQLAMVVGENFRCHVYLAGGTRITFLGLKEDVEIAKAVYKFAHVQALHHAREYRIQRKRRLMKESGLPDFKKMDHIDVVCFAQDIGMGNGYVMNLAERHWDNNETKKRVIVTAIKKHLGISGDGAEIRNTFLKGFLKGLRDAFEKQKADLVTEFGLVLVKDEEVDDAYKALNLRSGGSSRVRTKADPEAFEAGRKRGADFKQISGELE